MTPNRFTALLTFIAVFASADLLAKAPNNIDIQAAVLNDGGLVPDGDYQVTFRLFDAIANGSELASDGPLTVTVVGGVFDTVFKVANAALFHENDDVWLEVEVIEPVAAKLGRKQLSSVGFAFSAYRAESSDTADGLSAACSGCVSAGHIGFEYVEPGDLGAYAKTADLSAYAKLADLSDYAKLTDLSDYAKTADLSAYAKVEDSLGGLADECDDSQIPKLVGGIWVCSEDTGGLDPPECTGTNHALQFDGIAYSCVDVTKAGLTGGKANGFEAVDDWGDGWDGMPRAQKSWADATADCAARGARLPTMTELYRNRHSGGGHGNIGTQANSEQLWTMIPTVQDQVVTLNVSDGTSVDKAEADPQAYRCVWPLRDAATVGLFDGDFCNGEPGQGCYKHKRWNVDANTRQPASLLSAIHECAAYNAGLPSIREVQELAQNAGFEPTPAWPIVVGEELLSNNTNYRQNVAQQFGQTMFVVNASPQSDWQYSVGETDYPIGQGGLGASQNPVAFRCIGRAEAEVGALPPSPLCRGECFTTEKGRYRLTLDSERRELAQWGQARETCRQLGGDLPTVAEYTQAIHSGLPADGPNPAALELWSSEAIFRAGFGAGVLRVRNAALGAKWLPINAVGFPGTVEYNLATQIAHFRCVWRETLEPNGAVACSATENLVWKDSAYSCEASVDGSSGGQAKGAQEFQDDWGNAWDSFDRSAATWAAASADCQTLGARLPTNSELHRVSAATLVTTQKLPIISEECLWTFGFAPDKDKATCVNAAGTVLGLAKSASTAYRCVWPASAGDGLSGRGCYGPKDQPCFQLGHLRTDAVLRPSMSQSTAAYECALAGGRLPTMSEWAAIEHSDPANSGTGWLNEVVDNEDGRHYLVAMPLQDGAPYWQPLVDVTIKTADPVDTEQSFRCIFSTGPSVEVAKQACAYGDCGAGVCCKGISCKHILALDPAATSGSYDVDPDGNAPQHLPMPVSCDMETDGGGWTLGARWDGTSTDYLEKAGFAANSLVDVGGLGKLHDLSLRALATESYRLKTTDSDRVAFYEHNNAVGVFASDSSSLPVGPVLRIKPAWTDEWETAPTDTGEAKILSALRGEKQNAQGFWCSDSFTNGCPSYAHDGKTGAWDGEEAGPGWGQPGELWIK